MFAAWIRVALAIFVLSVGAISATAGTPLEWSVREPPPIAGSVCGKEGEACCRPPVGSSAAAFPWVVSCKGNLGCDVARNLCVKPCGETGQVCCDGPETTAPRWSPDGSVVESPNSRLLQPMCRSGACDRTTHVCRTCGAFPGAECCAPDAQVGTAFCSGNNLQCAYRDESLTTGTCAICGALGSKPCDRGGCDPGLGELSGLCAECGAADKPACDVGCNRGLVLVGAVCKPCGEEHVPPCADGCKNGLGIIAGFCSRCGFLNQIACDDGCRGDLLTAGGICTFCGHEGLVPCDVGGCFYDLSNEAGICRACGRIGEAPCASGCRQGRGSVAGICVISCGLSGEFPCDGTGCIQGLPGPSGLCASP